MSGGSLDYFYSQLNDHIGDFKDIELDSLVEDLAKLFHDREWYLSGDYSVGDWMEARDNFKKKWFSDSGRKERIEQYLDDVKTELLQSLGLEEKYCKNCENWTFDDTKNPGSAYGRCSLISTCLMHRCESCENWKRRED